MSSQFKTQVAQGNFTPDTLACKGEALKSAASEWAGGVKEVVRDRIVETGHKADTYVRSHPGRFIAGACCLGLAAGWVLGRTRRSDRP